MVKHELINVHLQQCVTNNYKFVSDSAENIQYFRFRCELFMNYSNNSWIIQLNNSMDYIVWWNNSKKLVQKSNFFTQFLPKPVVGMWRWKDMIYTHVIRSIKQYKVYI